MDSDSWSSSGPDGPPPDPACDLDEAFGPAAKVELDSSMETLRLLLVTDDASMIQGAERQFAALAAALARAGYAVTLACAAGGEPFPPAEKQGAGSPG